MTQSYDAIIVGARCAGVAIALLLARAGKRVLALDRSAYASDTLSTHALMRGGVLQLARFGVLERIKAGDTPKISATTFHYGGERLEIAIKPSGVVDALYAPRRTLLDALLVDAAREAGAEVRHGVRVADLTRRADGRVTGVVIEDAAGARRVLDAEIVIGADGIKSQVGRLAGAPSYHVARHTTAVTYGYYAGVPLAGYHWYYAKGVAAGAIPTGGGLTCVFVAVPPARHAHVLSHGAHAGFERALAQAAPELAAALRAAPRVSGFRAFAGRPGYLRTCHGPGWALVGDAGSFKDPIAAHGITDALRDAELLARALISGGSDAALAGYQAQRDALALPFLELSAAVASFAWDLPQVQALTAQLSAEMKREVRMLAELHATPTGAAA
jgi:2-polyprenyl-6-methoxyphenol hydroxylase-like FAD-dependent oxidoreductase